MTGSELANLVIDRFGTRDVRDIAVRSGIAVVWQNWHPVTAGEFDAKRMRIVINARANVTAERVLAHELGHYFLRDQRLELPNVEEICDDFASAMLD